MIMWLTEGSPSVSPHSRFTARVRRCIEDKLGDGAAAIGAEVAADHEVERRFVDVGGEEHPQTIVLRHLVMAVGPKQLVGTGSKSAW